MGQASCDACLGSCGRPAVAGVKDLQIGAGRVHVGGADGGRALGVAVNSQSAVPSAPVVTCPCSPGSPWVPASAWATVTPGTRAPESRAVTVTVSVTFVPAGDWATCGVTAGYEFPADPGTPEGGELLETLYAELGPGRVTNAGWLSTRS